MDLLNETDLPAELFRSVLPDPDVLLGVVVAKATYRLNARGKPVRDRDDPLPVAREAIETPWGLLPPDNVPRKDHVDLVVLGNVYAHDDRPARQATASLVVGSSFAAAVTVFGDRRWRRRTGKTQAGQARGARARASREGTARHKQAEYVADEPEEFTSLPMRWEQSYGGAAEVNDQQVPHPDNPLGRGYLVPGATVEGALLPNIEDPAALVTAWTDAPRPLNFAPMPPGSRYQSEGAVSVDEATGAMEVHPRFFNAAHPRLRVPALRGGEVVELTGMTRGGTMRFKVPRVQLEVHVALSDRRYTFPIRIDTLCILPEENRFALTYRSPFTYQYVREEIRVARLALAPQ